MNIKALRKREWITHGDLTMYGFDFAIEEGNETVWYHAGDECGPLVLEHEYERDELMKEVERGKTIESIKIRKF